MLKVIQIVNIKGIGNKRFDLDIIPNRPSLLVAPNGFGKSSFATAFSSLNNRRIDLKDDDRYEDNVNKAPKISIEYQRLDNTIVNLEATETTNTIQDILDYFVINNATRPKGIGSQHGRASAVLEIKDVILIDRIPPTTSFGYQYRLFQQAFGVNGKVLTNITSILANRKIVKKLSHSYLALQRANGVMVQRKITAVKDSVNAQAGTGQQLQDWLTANKIEELKVIEYLNTIANIINQFDIEGNTETKSYLSALQIITLYNSNINNFKAACDYSNYLLDKERFELTLSHFNSTWKNIRASQTGGKLVVKFPNARHISNGQRDILTFISMLFRARKRLTKEDNILIIDEVFDYLDDANLIAAQYYITGFIKEFQDEGKRLYPLILTHLDPNYFKNFAFSKQKVYYLDRTVYQVNQQMIRLIKNRRHPSIEVDVSKHLLHFEPTNINKRAEFRNLALPELWGESTNFCTFLNDELQKYLNNQPYCPLAVCGAVRNKIERIAYGKLQNAQSRATFLNTHKTRSKLEIAEEMGVISPESHYLLGLIYNEGMHWKDGVDIITPIASKLENPVIRKIISDI